MVARPWLTLVAVSLGVMMLLLDTSIVSVVNRRSAGTWAARWLTCNG
jgi:hypothetical protein